MLRLYGTRWDTKIWAKIIFLIEERKFYDRWRVDRGKLWRHLRILKAGGLKSPVLAKVKASVVSVRTIGAQGGRLPNARNVHRGLGKEKSQGDKPIQITILIEKYTIKHYNANYQR